MLLRVAIKEVKCDSRRFRFVESTRFIDGDLPAAQWHLRAKNASTNVIDAFLRVILPKTYCNRGKR